MGVHLDLADSEIDRAHDALRAARRKEDANGVIYRMPCVKNPLLFDAKNDGEMQRRFDQRTAVAKELCVTSCKVFRECLALSRADPSIWGVVAGRILEDPERVKKREGRKRRAAKGK